MNAPAMFMPVSVRGIAIKVCLEMRLSIDDVLGPCRKDELVRARAAIVWLAQRLTKASLPETGRRLNRDHSSIIHLRRKAEYLRTADPEFARITSKLALAEHLLSVRRRLEIQEIADRVCREVGIPISDRLGPVVFDLVLEQMTMEQVG